MFARDLIGTVRLVLLSSTLWALFLYSGRALADSPPDPPAQQENTMPHRPSATFLWTLMFLFLLVFESPGCHRSDSSDSPLAPATEWVTVESVVVSGTPATLSGTAWVSQGYVALRCAGMSCLSDTSTNSYPGVDINCTNLTTGAAGSATSFYGGGTNWIHQWRASVPVGPGMNTIQVSAFDPGGKGGSVTVHVTR